ncbi:MAG: glycerol-3-phosphate 1-O-acyltransferase PlsY [Bacilli bacterium]|jgi:glycerol-3-phosphate acyltransferase PlsY
MEILCLLICAVLAYLIGAIPWAIIISRLFFHIDVRDYGSRNAGGTNAGRVMGKRIGLLVIVLDTCKILIIFLLNRLIIFNFFGFTSADMIYTYCQLLSTVCATLGHCYPIYCSFKGGKAVSCSTGFVAFTNWIIFPICFLTFIGILKKTKYVSLSSMTSSFISVILAFIAPLAKLGLWFDIQYDIVYPLTATMLFIILFFRHSENIKRLKNGVENKITWLK